jgi:hypothetical protein
MRFILVWTVVIAMLAAVAVPVAVNAAAAPETAIAVLLPVAAQLAQEFRPKKGCIEVSRPLGPMNAGIIRPPTLRPNKVTLSAAGTVGVVFFGRTISVTSWSSFQFDGCTRDASEPFDFALANLCLMPILNYSLLLNNT